MASIAPVIRSDARANRKLLLDTARTALTGNPQASLNSIAKAAGVGPGTLYRHFPSREALVVAVNRSEVEQLVPLARALLADYAPLSAFRLWCDRLIDHVVRQRGFRETLSAVLSLAEQEQTYRPVREAIELLLQACELEGSIRPGIDSIDVQLLLSFIWQVRTPEGERRAHRAVDIILHGLNASVGGSDALKARS